MIDAALEKVTFLPAVKSIRKTDIVLIVYRLVRVVYFLVLFFNFSYSIWTNGLSKEKVFFLRLIAAYYYGRDHGLI